MSRRKILLRILCVITAVITSSWTVSAICEDEEEPEYYTLYVMCKPNSFVNARIFPNKKAEVVGRVELGDEIMTLGERRGKYIKVYSPKFESGTCWIHKGYLTEDRPDVYEDGKAFIVQAKGRVAVRRYIRGARRVWIEPGKTVKVYAITEEWALTNRGFIKREYLEEAANNADASIIIFGNRRIGSGRGNGWIYNRRTMRMGGISDKSA